MSRVHHDRLILRQQEGYDAGVAWIRENIPAEAAVAKSLAMEYILKRCFGVGDGDHERVAKGLVQQSFLTTDKRNDLIELLDGILNRALIGKGTASEAEDDESEEKEIDNVHTLPVTNHSDNPSPKRPRKELKRAAG